MSPIGTFKIISPLLGNPLFAIYYPYRSNSEEYNISEDANKNENRLQIKITNRVYKMLCSTEYMQNVFITL